MRSLLPLNEFRLLAVAGPERGAFLQGQLTQDVATIGGDATVLAGWADARGRLLFAGHAFKLPAGVADAFALLVPAELAESLAKRLRLFVLRAKVTVDLLEIPVAGAIGATDGLRLHGDNSRCLLLGQDLPAASAGSSDAWRLADIRAGLPVVLPATNGEFVPQMLNLDLLGGISFTKGCYTGQEIVARTKYLGRVKRRMFHLGSPATPPPPGAAIHAARGVVGQVVTAAAVPEGCEFLAVLVLDDLPGPFFLDAALTVPARRLGLPYEIPV